MEPTDGHVVPLSPARKLMGDWLYFSARASYAAVERTMDLGPVAAARACANPKPGWFTIMLKAYSLACQRHPELRRSYLSLPSPRLYEHAVSVANLAMERELDGEQVILPLRLAEPENRSLADLDTFIRNSKDLPLKEVKSFRRALRQMGRPWWLRRLLWWYVLNFSGKLRHKYFGTFGITGVSNRGADGLFTLSPLTSVLCLGQLTPDHTMTIRVFFDHRVADGGPVARTVLEMENILTNEIMGELRSMAPFRLRAA